jgi:hypothetical protein
MFLQLTVVKVKFKVERKERANLGFLLSYIGFFQNSILLNIAISIKTSILNLCRESHARDNILLIGKLYLHK